MIQSVPMSYMSMSSVKSSPYIAATSYRSPVAGLVADLSSSLSQSDRWYSMVMVATGT